MLWIGLYFPYLALDVFSAETAVPQHKMPTHEVPMVVEHTVHRRRLVLLASDAALQAGIRPGMSIASAFGRCASLQVKSRDPALEVQAMQRLALALYNVSPHLQIIEPDQIIVEISSNLALFGGREALLKMLQESVATESLRYHIVGYDTAKGARALARHVTELNSAAYFTRQALEQCPLDATELPPTEISRLQGMGLKTVGSLLSLPDTALAKRLSPQSQRYLQEISGTRADLRPLYQLPDQFESQLELGHESSHYQGLLFPLKRLLKALEHYLRARQQLAACVVLVLKRRDLSEEILTLVPSQGAIQAEELLNLFRLRLERLKLTQPVVEIRLVCKEFLPWKPAASDLFDSASNPRISPENLVDLLQARLGENRITGRNSPCNR